MAGDTRGASLLRTSAQADESAAGLQAELSGVIDEAGALGGDGWQACEAERPNVCTMIYDPVCARRSSGEVADYASPCNACADITVTGWHPETCEE